MMKRMRRRRVSLWVGKLALILSACGQAATGALEDSVQTVPAPVPSGDSASPCGPLKPVAESPPDAVIGEGYLVIRQPGYATCLTRLGGFSVVGDYVESPHGLRLQAYGLDRYGRRTDDFGDLKIPGSLPSAVTKTISMIVEFDGRTEFAYEPFNVANPSGTSVASQGLIVRDPMYRRQRLTMYYTRIADAEWAWNLVAVSDDVVSNVDTEFISVARGELEFNSVGLLSRQTQLARTVTFVGAASQDIEVDFTSSSNLPCDTAFDCTSVIGLYTDGLSGGLRIRGSEVVSPNGDVTVSYEHRDHYSAGRIGFAIIRESDGAVEVADGLFYVEPDASMVIAPIFEVDLGLLRPEALLAR